MLDAIRNFFTELSASADDEARPVIDKKLASAALLVQVMAADGIVRPEEEAKLKEVLLENYDLSPGQAEEFAEEARETQNRAVDLYGFTSVLKRDMSEDERLSLVEDLWEMVFADGNLHEFEDNVVWRVAELLNVQSRVRLQLKRRVEARQD
ncbi:MAG: TerB family tellurite resistance protein [Ahrensia sp.]|nr:TerB family tellurite resistance protein [Ahrensia sp.]